jgi:hypothetical protein
VVPVDPHEGSSQGMATDTLAVFTVAVRLKGGFTIHLKAHSATGAASLIDCGAACCIAHLRWT